MYIEQGCCDVIDRLKHMLSMNIKTGKCNIELFETNSFLYEIEKKFIFEFLQKIEKLFIFEFFQKFKTLKTF